MGNTRKIKCYLTSPVFRDIADHPMLSERNKKEILKLWKRLEEVTDLRVSKERFPSDEEITNQIRNWGAQIIGCHLSHPITSEMLKGSDVVAVCTSTVGYNHIAQEPGIIITHTPGVLHQTVADFTIAVILANLRNIVYLHNFVWNGNWKPDQNWDLDENLNCTMSNLTLGIVGMGEIGKEVTKRIYHWGVKILYYDVKQQKEFENYYSNIQFIDSLEEIFSQSDIVSLHVPLVDVTHHLVNEDLLKKMKKGALLVNTARGSVINFDDLVRLLENREIEINLAFDVYEQEPIEDKILLRLKKIVEKTPRLRFVFIPHNASADANTRAQMAIMFLEDIITIAISTEGRNLSSLRLIPEQRFTQIDGLYESWKIKARWEKKKK